MRGLFKFVRTPLLVGALLTMLFAMPLLFNSNLASTAFASAAIPHFASTGNLDCNGFSAIQKPLRITNLCADPIGYGRGRASDNGHYIGHDEPTVNFFSNSPGSGSNVQWQVTLPREHALPATHTFENTPAEWFGMVLCDPQSFPMTACTPDSDKNSPARFAGDANTSGSAFLELQMYPPGFSPFITQISCDTTHWCAALNIDSLECSAGFQNCNPNCTEPVNFAFVQTDGVPAGPPGPATADNSTFTPNAKTLLMNQGDTLRVTIKDTQAGLFTRIEDLTTGQSGFMVASAKNGFENTNPTTCAGTPFSFHPEYSTTRFGNFLNWGLGQGNVGYDIETGHFETGLNGDGDADDAPCFSGPTIPGCIGGDTDFDGTAYRPDWPDGTKQTATSVRIGSALGNGFGPVSALPGTSNYRHPYSTLQFDTEVLATETTCTQQTLSGCTVPPPGATFYPFFTQAGQGANCTLMFGNDISGQTINDFGRDLQYGMPNQAWSFLDSSSGIQPNPCTPQAN